jgi:hypothetical protein
VLAKWTVTEPEFMMGQVEYVLFREEDGSYRLVNQYGESQMVKPYQVDEEIDFHSLLLEMAELPIKLEKRVTKCLNNQDRELLGWD